MKALVCELCGSNNIVKQDGYFVCQNCGTRYDTEEAKKLMLEGKIDVSGSAVIIDESGSNERNLINARNARKSGDWEDAKKYYSLVKEYDPANTEAIVFSSIAKVMIALNKKDYKEFSNALLTLRGSVLNNINENFDSSKTEETVTLLSDISLYIEHLSLMAMLARSANDLVIIEGIIDLHKVFRKVLVDIANKISNDAKKQKITCYELSLKSANWVLENISLAHPERVRQEIITCHQKLNELDPSHSIPTTPPEPTKKSGCYVATAVYGSYDCPQVWTLRRYRDNTLAKTWYGRAFVHTYYAISPTLVKWFGETEWFKNMWKPKLDKMVNTLNEQGVDDTPYSDRIW